MPPHLAWCRSGEPPRPKAGRGRGIARARRAIAWAAACLATGPMAPPARAQSGSPAAEVPCTVLRSAAHGVVLLGARVELQGGPPCALMLEYRDWLQRSDALVLGTPRRGAPFTGHEWDFAAGAVRLGAPAFFTLIRGDSLSALRPGRPRRLHLTAFAAGENEPVELLGSWYVLVEQDSGAPRLFRSAFTRRRPRRVLEDRGVRVLALPGVDTDPARIRRQIADAAALRAALGFDGPLPEAHVVLGARTDTTLSMLGVLTKHRTLYAMTVFPPLVVFGPVTAEGGIDAHELVHLATFGRRDVIPAGVGEAYAMHHGGSHGRPFQAALCASQAIAALPPLTAAGLDSALAGRWWHETRGDVAGFALGHAMGWFLTQHADSAWVFAVGEPSADGDALGFLARRTGIPRDSALSAVAAGLEARRATCPVSRPSAAALAPAPGTP